MPITMILVYGDVYNYALMYWWLGIQPQDVSKLTLFVLFKLLVGKAKLYLSDVVFVCQRSFTSFSEKLERILERIEKSMVYLSTDLKMILRRSEYVKRLLSITLFVTQAMDDVVSHVVRTTGPTNALNMFPACTARLFGLRFDYSYFTLLYEFLRSMVSEFAQTSVITRGILQATARYMLTLIPACFRLPLYAHAADFMTFNMSCFNSKAIFQTSVGLTSVISQCDDSTVPEVTYTHDHAMSLSEQKKVDMIHRIFVNHVNLQLSMTNFPVSYRQAIFQAIALYFKPRGVFKVLDQCRSQSRYGVMALHVSHCSPVTSLSQCVPSRKLDPTIFPQINCGDASQNIEATSKSYYQTAKAEFDSFSQCDTSWQLKPQSGVPIKCIVLRNSWTFDVKNAAESDFSSRLCASPCFCSTFQGKETGLVIPLQAVPEIQAFPTASPFKRCAREVSNAKTTYECYKSRAAQNFGTQSISSLSPSNRRQISSVSRWQAPDDTPTDLIHGARRNTVSDRTIYQDDSTQDVFRTGPPSQQVSAQPSKAMSLFESY